MTIARTGVSEQQKVKKWKEYCSILVTRAVESGKFAYRTARDCNQEQF